jgi:diguanylate cyclase (GGDEF)-like protein/PAS domain S-box-containing protein
MKEFDFNFKDIVEFAKDVIIVTKSFPLNEPGPEIVYVNKAFTELTGYTQEDVSGNNPRMLQTNETDEETKNIIRQGLERHVPVRATVKNYSKTGEEYWLDLSIMPLRNSQGIVSHFVAIQRDVTEQKNIEQKLEVLSRKDPLTGLLNRRSLDEILENELSRFKRSGEIYSLLVLDIDHFKLINDNYGHSTGDVAIQTITQSCESNLRLYDKMARVGGEEFCVLLPLSNKKVAYAIAEKLREVVSNTSITTRNGDISITVSIGVSEVENTDIDHTAVLKRADENMYKAKKTGRNRVCI